MRHRRPPSPYASNPEEMYTLFIDALGANYRKKAAELFGVDIRTVKRWLDCNPRPSRAVLMVLSTMAYGLHNLPGAGEEWRNWFFQDGILMDLEDKYGRHTPGSIRAYWWTKQEITAFQRRENLQNRQIEETEAENVVSLETVRSNIGNLLFHNLHKRLKDMANNG